MKLQLHILLILGLYIAACTPAQQQLPATPAAADSMQPTDSSGFQATTDAIHPQGADAEGIAFGFANTEGNALLSTTKDGLPNAAQFTHAIANGGKPYDIRFERKKSATPNDNGRQTNYNFAECGGDLYNVLSGTINADSTVILVTDAFLESHTTLKLLDFGPQTLSPATRKQVETSKGRKIQKFRGLNQVEGQGSIYLLVFSRKGDSALASLALVGPDRVAYLDFPATYDEVSTWRVDDGGEFGLNDIAILAAFLHKGKVQIITDWAGAESIAIDYLQADDQKLNSIKSDGRYCAPL